VGGDVYDQAVARAAALGMADVFMGAPEERVSFVAHGVGLEVDELPLLARGYKGVLEEGMVLAVEPKAVFPALGCVGLENTTVVTPDGLVSLSLSSEEIVVV
jgi:Xaa-Pro aminopeptidase